MIRSFIEMFCANQVGQPIGLLVDQSQWLLNVKNKVYKEIKSISKKTQLGNAFVNIYTSAQSSPVCFSVLCDIEPRPSTS